MSDPRSAEAITAASKSNLALAFISLPPERRRDITTFYAFCRIVDDIADEPGDPVEKEAQLAQWRRAIDAEIPEEPPLAPAIRDLAARYQIPREHFHEIIAGVAMDLRPARYETFDDLRLYCHRVASVVGLVSIEIFGYTDPGCRRYALDLGMALQLTNIIRDVARDHANGGRIYLPLEDMARFDYPPEALAEKRYDEKFIALMEHETGRANAFYHSARAHLPAADRRSMVAAEIMRAIYNRLLERMERDRFRVFDHDYRLSRAHKLWLVATTLWRVRR